VHAERPHGPLTKILIRKVPDSTARLLGMQACHDGIGRRDSEVQDCHGQAKSSKSLFLKSGPLLLTGIEGLGKLPSVCAAFAAAQPGKNPARG
jgi:hypothetical protein